MVWLRSLLIVLFLTGCSTVPSGLELIDPTITWNAVTKDCLGDPISGVTYNVYIVTTPAEIPMVQSPPTEVPCGGSKWVVDRTQINPHNSTPISGVSYHANLPTGGYKVGVEAVSADGVQSPVSEVKNFTVVLRPGTAIGVEIK